MVTSKKIVYIKAFDAMPKHENFQVVEEELPELKDGGIHRNIIVYFSYSLISDFFVWLEYLVEAVFFSVDPYLRIWPCEIGQAMIGTQVGKYE